MVYLFFLFFLHILSFSTPHRISWKERNNNFGYLAKEGTAAPAYSCSCAVLVCAAADWKASSTLFRRTSSEGTDTHQKKVVSRSPLAPFESRALAGPCGPVMSPSPPSKELLRTSAGSGRLGRLFFPVLLLGTFPPGCGAGCACLLHCINEYIVQGTGRPFPMYLTMLKYQNTIGPLGSCCIRTL